MALSHLFLELVALLVLLRYRALVPLMYLMLLAEHLARRLIVGSYAAPGATSSTIAFSINAGLLALMTVGLFLSLFPARSRVRIAP